MENQERLALVRAAIRRAAEATGAKNIPEAVITHCMHGRDEEFLGDLAHALKLADEIGTWIGFRWGGTPVGRWPESARRPNQPKTIHCPRGGLYEVQK